LNNLNELKNILAVVTEAEKNLNSGLALYKFKSLFDGVILSDLIDFGTEYGQLLTTSLTSKRKKIAHVNIIRVRSSLECTIKSLQKSILDSKAKEQSQDELAIESTCEVVIVPRNDKDDLSKEQLQLDNMPKKLGRPNTGKALSNAERSKRARDKKKTNKLVTVNASLSIYSSQLYNAMINDGYDLNSIIEMAHSSIQT
jgi:hypothetical protein